MSHKKNKITGRKGFVNRIGYKAFKAKYPGEQITYDEYISVLKASNMAIRDHILDNPLGFKLPYNIGYLAVDKFKGLSHYVAVDWVNSRRLGKLIPLTNLHSFGYFYKIKMYKNPKVKPLLVYRMEAHRIIKRMLAAKIKAGKEYLQIDRGYFSKRFHIGETLKLT